ncbi:hypothetical protein Ddye_000794, partial [Dipteronia dyeriana]
NYFTENPRYNDQMFRRCFQMGKSLFLCIVEKVEARDNYFVQRRDSLGRLSLSTLQKITVVFQMLAYGCPVDVTDKYIKIEESTTIEFEEILSCCCGEIYCMNNDINVLEASHLFSNLAQGIVKVLDASHLFSNLAQGLTRFRHKHILHDIMTTCIIMHNMIIADERDVDASIDDHMEAPTPKVEMVLVENIRFQQFLARYREINDKDALIAL